VSRDVTAMGKKARGKENSGEGAFGASTLNVSTCNAYRVIVLLTSTHVRIQ
jgi:hypothetical protein